jgi:hypothetical protein
MTMMRKTLRSLSNLALVEFVGNSYHDNGEFEAQLKREIQRRAKKRKLGKPWKGSETHAVV